jgi:high-affinity iron transporter
MLCLAAVLVFSGARAADNNNEVQVTWQLLDYIAVDYAGAVEQGAVVNATEYAEQAEFAATAAAKIAALPAHAQQNDLLREAARLQSAIDDKADAALVAAVAHELASALLVVYPVPLAPKTAPEFTRGAAVFSDTCAACHGQSGAGDGPAAAALSPPPIAFTDHERAAQRSLFALYQSVTLGVADTPMPGFADLPDEDRWALAFIVGQFAFPQAQVAAGERLWQTDMSLHQLIPNLEALISLAPAALAERIGKENADALLAFLRRHPEVLMQQQPSGSLTLVRERLTQSLAASRAGNREQASALALSAYLDGFEPSEPALKARDATLMRHIEGDMLDYRVALQRGESVEQLAERQQVLNVLFTSAEEVLNASEGSMVSTFFGAATILLREGVEALLIVVAMVAFLRKAERTEVMPYVHGGWIGALVAGVLTWIVATWMIEISGASRELTEGFGSLFAAAVLLSVGIWMHGKAQAGQWQRYIRDAMAKALSGRSAWLLFGLAFIVVYREVFETILFYAALSAQGNGLVMLAGALSAGAVLAAIAWIMLRYSRKLPISEFFTYSSWLMALLTVVLTGKGVAALQEAGIIGITPLASLPRLEWVGLFPTLQSGAAQALTIALLLLGFAWNKRESAQH